MGTCMLFPNIAQLESDWSSFDSPSFDFSASTEFPIDSIQFDPSEGTNFPNKQYNNIDHDS
mgnify:CR=1 FL=1